MARIYVDTFFSQCSKFLGEETSVWIKFGVVSPIGLAKFVTGSRTSTGALVRPPLVFLYMYCSFYIDSD